MKKMFVPKGDCVTHHYLNTDRIVVKGVLRISGKLMAKEILGGGVIEAREIVCDSIHANTVTADYVTAKRIAANKLFVQFDCRASESIAATDYITAGYVDTGKLSMTRSDIKVLDADEIIILKQRHGLLGLLWASWWRSLFLSLFYSKPKENGPKVHEKQDAGNSAQAPEAEKAPEPAAEPEIDRMLDVIAALQARGYSIVEGGTALYGEKEKAS